MTLLTPDHRHALLLADRTLDIKQVRLAVVYVLTSNPGATLLDCEMALRDAAAHSYIVSMADDGDYQVVMGMVAWRKALDKQGLTAEQNHGRLLQQSGMAEGKASSTA